MTENREIEGSARHGAEGVHGEATGRESWRWVASWFALGACLLVFAGTVKMALDESAGRPAAGKVVSWVILVEPLAGDPGRYVMRWVPSSDLVGAEPPVSGTGGAWMPPTSGPGTAPRPGETWRHRLDGQVVEVLAVDVDGVKVRGMDGGTTYFTYYPTHFGQWFERGKP